MIFSSVGDPKARLSDAGAEMKSSGRPNQPHRSCASLVSQRVVCVEGFRPALGHR